MSSPQAGRQSGSCSQVSPARQEAERRASFRVGRGRRGSQPLYTGALKSALRPGQKWLMARGLPAVWSGLLGLRGSSHRDIFLG